MKIGPKILIAITILCVVFYIGVFVGRTSSRSTLYVPAVSQDHAAPVIPQIDLNDTNAQELAMLPGITDYLANAIIAYKDEYGDYVDTDELLNIDGITDELYSSILRYITVGG